MQQTPYSQQYLRKRKALLLMPLIVIPFIIFFAWILGIVGPAEATAQTGHDAQGINTNLPAAVPSKDSTWDKLSFYEQADKDSAKLKQLQRQDPYFNKNKKTDDLLKKYDSKLNYQPYPEATLNEADEQEKKVYERINAIHKEIAKAPRQKTAKREQKEEKVAVPSKDVDRLERMMDMMNNKEPEADPEMQQLAAFMENIKDIQHPERVTDRLKREEIKPKVFEVSAQAKEPNYAGVATNRFYSLENSEPVNAGEQQFISAVVHETQTVASDELVKIRLVQSIFINGNELPENHFIYGQAKIKSNRLLVHVPAIQINGTHFPVSLDIFGSDGMEGIPINNSTTSDAINNTIGKSGQGISLNSMDASLGAQVAGAAVQGGKSLLKKQTKIIKYTIPAGYPVTLKSVQ